ncbi:MAG TPA: hypothetical protein VFG39_04400 [Balneolaceae bacterium]|nr:hypothetical protein [Balneolaceae bacterium]
MVFASEKSYCFLEMKVNASEGNGQLEKYVDVLNHLVNEDLNPRNYYLRYCSQFCHPKEISCVNFKRFYWADIASFLKERMEDNLLIEIFYQFLEERNMADMDYTIEDVVAISRYSEVFSKSDDYGFHLRFEKKLVSFMEEENQLEEIQEWVTKRLDEMLKFKENHSSLDWLV